MKEKRIQNIVREKYGKIAKQERSCCASEKPCCYESYSAEQVSQKIGYSEKDIEETPEGANLGLGCGNPVALASLKKGETVLDLGSGAGFDSFLAANRVGKEGKVIGVDMTPEMIEKARENAVKGQYDNVEFRLGEIEDLPVSDSSVDVIISNCVVNLSLDKKKVFAEAFRVLRPGGRLMVSDIVLVKELPDFVKKSVEAYVGCISGAIMKEEYLEAIEAMGFLNVEITDEKSFPADSIVNDSAARAISAELDVPVEKLKEAASAVLSISVSGIKPFEAVF